MKSNRKLVFICTGSDCKKAGSKSLSQELKDASKDQSLRGSCKFFKTKCLDRCKSAPVVIVGDHFIKKATCEIIVSELKKY